MSLVTKSKYPAGYCAAMILLLALFGANDEPRKAVDIGKDANDRLAFVNGVLDQRDAELNNFSYECAESRWNFEPATGKKTAIAPELAEEEFGFKRMGDLLLFHQKRASQEYVTNWNGNVSLNLVTSKPPEAPTGTIQEFENGNFKDRITNYILGFRVPEDGYKDMREWLARQHKAGAALNLTRTEADAGHLLVFEVLFSRPEAMKSTKFTFDEQKGNSLVRVETRYEAFKAKVTAALSIVVTESKQINGVWIPWVVESVVSNSASHGMETRSIYKMKSFTIGDVKEKDMEVTFPEGIHILDRTKGEEYVLKPNGEKEFFPVYNQTTGKITTGGVERMPVLASSALAHRAEPDRAETAASPVKTVTSAQTDPSIVGVATPKPNSQHLWRIVGATAILLGLYLVYRMIALKRK